MEKHPDSSASQAGRYNELMCTHADGSSELGEINFFQGVIGIKLDDQT